MKTGLQTYLDSERISRIEENNRRELYGSAEGNLRANAVFIDLNNGCNLRCPGCYKYMNIKWPLESLSIEEISDIINFAGVRGAETVVYAGAGEPLMDTLFWGALDYARGKGMSTVLFTNGTLISRQVADRLYTGNASVVIKVNTLDTEKQDKLLGGIEGDSKRAMRGLENLISAGFSSPRLAIQSYTSRQNAKDLKEVLRYCRQRDIMPYFEAFIDVYQPESIRERLLTQEEFDTLLCELQKIDKKEFNIPTEIKKGSRVYGQGPCNKNLTMFSVRCNGDVALCVSDPRIIGNIREEPLEKIFDKDNEKLKEVYGSECNCSVKASGNDRES